MGPLTAAGAPPAASLSGARARGAGARWAAAAAPLRRPGRRAATRVAAAGNDGNGSGGGKDIGKRIQGELLDFVTAGPKMRKWYGATSAARDGGEDGGLQQQQEQEQEDGERDVVLVTDADTPTGELVVLQLILLRAKVRVLVRDTAAAANGYGPYVEPMSVDLGSPGGLARALRGVRTVVVLGKLGGLLPAAQKAGVQRLVLLSTAGMPQPGGLAGLFQGAADAQLKDAAREAAVAGCAIPHVVVKAGTIQDVPGGGSSISVAPAAAAGGSSGPCSVTREDLASALVASATCSMPALDRAGAAGAAVGAAPSLAFQVRDAGPGAPPESWDQLVSGLAS